MFGGEEPWQQFFEVSDQPRLTQPFGPRSNLKGGLTRHQLADRLGLSEEQLFRRCDRKTRTRQRAEIIFYTRFAKQVGRSALHGWRTVLQPAHGKIAIWPFDGDLVHLLAKPGIVVCEIYPAEAAAQLGLLQDPRSSWSKQRPEDRRRVVAALEAAAATLGLGMSTNALAALRVGFDSSDDFDAFVALLSMLSVVRGKRSAGAPDDEEISRCEGWILGQSDDPFGHIPSPRVSLSGPITRGPAVPYYVHSLRWGAAPDEVVDLAYPVAPGRGALNVLCGLNNTGKSFLLDQVRRLLTGRPHAPHLEIEPTPPAVRRLLMLGKAWHAKDKIGVVNLEQRQSGLALPQPLGDYRRTGLALLAAQMASHLEGVAPENAATRLLEPAVRDQIAARFPPERHIFRCRADDPTIARLESILEGDLYFRCAKRSTGNWQFEFVLLDENGNSVPFEEWSEGQRACFYLLASLAQVQPDIVLFDELENHLHPAYMSHVLDALRDAPVQSIIATHHPHLIFSRFADRVFLIETRRPGRRPSPPPTFPYSKRHAEQPFQRRARPLEDELARISAAYGLFAEHDNLLLRQTLDARSHASLALIAALQSLFAPTPEGPTRRPFPDAQTEQLANLLRRAPRPREANRDLALLDLGAGLGRQLVEFGKLSAWQLATPVRWTCFEPIPTLRRQLEERFPGHDRPPIVGDLSELGSERFTFCLLANVIHELTPPELVAYLGAADARADHEHGGIVVLEVYPLLRPEGFAVPLTEGLTLDLLNGSGLSADSTRISIRRPGVTAYCVLARRRDPSVPLNVDHLDAAISTAWQQTLERALDAYSFREPPRTLEAHQSLLSNLATIASISAWREGRWRPGGHV